MAGAQREPLNAELERAWRASTTNSERLQLIALGDKYLTDISSDRRTRLLAVACLQVMETLPGEVLPSARAYLDQRLGNILDCIENFQRNEFFCRQEGLIVEKEFEMPFGFNFNLHRTNYEQILDPDTDANLLSREKTEGIADLLLCTLTAVNPGAVRLRVGNLSEALPNDSRVTDLIQDIFSNRFHPIPFEPAWRTNTVVSLSRIAYETREFAAMPILADALQDAGCDNSDILDHCRGNCPHTRGCWVVDLILGKQ